MTTLQEMIDDRDIRHGLARFARLLDTKDWARLGDVFADDIAFDYGAAGEEKGMDALRHNMRKHLDVCGPSQHLLANHEVFVDGDTATSITKARVYHQGAGDRHDRSFECLGDYHDTWARTADGWRMTTRRFDVHVMLGDFSVLQPG